jgi:hypothetical protein
MSLDEQIEKLLQYATPEELKILLAIAEDIVKSSKANLS